MKKIGLVILSFILSSSLFAGDYQDVAISLSSSSTYGYYGTYGIEDSLRLDAALSLGLTSHMELAAGSVMELTPAFLDEQTFYLELNYALLGKRSTASKVAGSGINMLLGIGGFYSRTFSSSKDGAGAYITFTPLTLGNPMTGRRERFLKTNLGYDFINERVVVSFSILGFDLYLRGTYRDYS